MTFQIDKTSVHDQIVSAWGNLIRHDTPTPCHWKMNNKTDKWKYLLTDDLIRSPKTLNSRTMSILVNLLKGKVSTSVNHSFFVHFFEFFSRHLGSSSEIFFILIFKDRFNFLFRRSCDTTDSADSKSVVY